MIYIFILVIGTIEQKNFGLQFAQDTYFNSNLIFFFNKIPIPGGKMLLILLCISLFLRLIMDKWKKKRIGTILLHFGILLLLLGAFFSSKYKIEGILILKENSYSNYFLRSDSFYIEILNKKLQKKYNEHISINIKDKILSFNELSVNLVKFNSNCKLFKRKKFLNKSEIDGAGRFFLINDFPPFVEQEENRIFLKIKVKLSEFEENFSLFGNVSINYETQDIKINIFKKHEVLPFNLFLSRFEKITYTGTEKVKNYISNLIIENNNNVTWKSKIEMNKPLRINNYSLYQTSYLDGEERSTVLTVVKDTWNFYPYISTFLIFLGFLIHLLASIKKTETKYE
ncbi:MAG TPA: cytochrome c biogenesis protein ResB [Candidatus Azoamicus sp.]